MGCTDDHHDADTRQDLTRLRQSGEIIDRLGRPMLLGQDMTIDVVPREPSPAAIARVARALMTDWVRREAAESRSSSRAKRPCW
jgi:hypothetical protein